MLKGPPLVQPSQGQVEVPNVIGHFIRHITLPTFLLILDFRAFSNIFLNILTALYRVYIIIPINVGPRNKRGSFQHPPIFRGKNFLQPKFDSFTNVFLMLYWRHFRGAWQGPNGFSTSAGSCNTTYNKKFKFQILITVPMHFYINNVCFSFRCVLF